jgi:hypothetical protein
VNGFTSEEVKELMACKCGECPMGVEEKHVCYLMQFCVDQPDLLALNGRTVQGRLLSGTRDRATMQVSDILEWMEAQMRIKETTSILEGCTRRKRDLKERHGKLNPGSADSLRFPLHPTP